jgi:hypothetical protein
MDRALATAGGKREGARRSNHQPRYVSTETLSWPPSASSSLASPASHTPDSGRFFLPPCPQSHYDSLALQFPSLHPSQVPAFASSLARLVSYHPPSTSTSPSLFLFVDCCHLDHCCTRVGVRVQLGHRDSFRRRKCLHGATRRPRSSLGLCADPLAPIQSSQTPGSTLLSDRPASPCQSTSLSTELSWVSHHRPSFAPANGHPSLFLPRTLPAVLRGVFRGPKSCPALLTTGTVLASTRRSVLWLNRFDCPSDLASLHCKDPLTWCLVLVSGNP